MSKLGVQRIIHPEDEMGIRVAQSLNYPMVNNYLAIGHGIYVVEIHIKQLLNGQTLSQVLGDVKNTIKPIMVKREETIFSQLEPLLCGTRAQLKYVAPRLV